MWDVKISYYTVFAQSGPTVPIFCLCEIQNVVQPNHLLSTFETEQFGIDIKTIIPHIPFKVQLCRQCRQIITLKFVLP